MSDIDAGYKFSVEVLLNLNHDRYKTYFAQFIVLQLGVFTALNIDKLSKLIPLFSIVGIIIGLVWFLTLRKINADIHQLWYLIEKHEKTLSNQSIKINESRTPILPCGKLMLSVPILFIVVHVAILIHYIHTLIPNQAIQGTA